MRLKRTPLVVAVALIVGGGLGVAARESGVSPVQITSGSMSPVVDPGDWIVVDEDRSPQRGDVVMFRHPFGSSLRAIKRVAARPGDTVEITPGQVAVNGRVIQRARAPEPVRPRREVVPAGSFFVLGDNAAGSHDSRAFGFVPERELVGRMRLVFPSPAWFIVALAVLVCVAVLIAKRGAKRADPCARRPPGGLQLRIADPADGRTTASRHLY